MTSLQSSKLFLYDIFILNEVNMLWQMNNSQIQFYLLMIGWARLSMECIETGTKFVLVWGGGLLIFMTLFLIRQRVSVKILEINLLSNTESNPDIKALSFVTVTMQQN